VKEVHSAPRFDQLLFDAYILFCSYRLFRWKLSCIPTAAESLDEPDAACHRLHVKCDGSLLIAQQARLRVKNEFSLEPCVQPPRPKIDISSWRGLFQELTGEEVAVLREPCQVPSHLPFHLH
jgi:hypothetical protein